VITQSGLRKKDCALMCGTSQSPVFSPSTGPCDPTYVQPGDGSLLTLLDRLYQLRIVILRRIKARTHRAREHPITGIGARAFPMLRQALNNVRPPSAVTLKRAFPDVLTGARSASAARPTAARPARSAAHYLAPQNGVDSAVGITLKPEQCRQRGQFAALPNKCIDRSIHHIRRMDLAASRPTRQRPSAHQN
jgi:hypothetical protein